MDFISAGSGSGGDFDGSNSSQKKKKRYHRHTAYQIQRLESMFKECPHPDEKQRLQLSRELALAPRQIKFWFQNRRTQMKGQQERSDNCVLRSENDKIRCENIAMREALKHIVCPSCGGPPVGEDSYFDEQKLQMENAHLKEELDRVSSIAAKYIGRPISQLPPMQPIHVSSLDLSMGSYRGSHDFNGSTLDLDLLPGNSLGVQPNFPLQVPGISDMDKSLMADIASNAMDELLRLLQTNEPLWIKSPTDGRDVLDIDTYDRNFPRPNSHLKSPHVRVEASRDSGVVIINGLTLVEMFMDLTKWAELFPTIVSAARTIEELPSGMIGNQSGNLQLMYGELMALSPLLPTREFYLLRYCQQIEQGLWAVVDVSYDFPQDNQVPTSCRCHKLPSGCLIQDMPNGYSKVTWVEHVEVEDKEPIHRLYRDLSYSGLAFGAERWLTTLQRMCERFACLMVTSNAARDLGGVIPSPEGKRSLMKLSQRLVSSFCASISTSNGHGWTTISNESGVRVTVRKSTEPGQANGVVLGAATTIWIPVSPLNVFNFFKDERTRSQWDVLSNGNAVQEVLNIANGPHPGNCISVLRATNTSQNNILLLQESCIDSSGSIIVYSPVELQSMNIAMSGEDPSYIPLIPSGFAISPDGSRSDVVDNNAASTSSSTVRLNGGTGGGSLITIAFQILVSSLPSVKLNLESVNTVNTLIGTTVQQIKGAFNCPTTAATSS